MDFSFSNQFCNNLLKITFETSLNGILVVDSDGKIKTFNEKFIKMWNIPDSLVLKLDDDQLLAFVIDQLKDSESFLAKVRKLYVDNTVESVDIIEFKDGRLYERHSVSFIDDQNQLYRFWLFIDLTESLFLKNNIKKINLRMNELHELSRLLVKSKNINDLLMLINKTIVSTYASSYSIDCLDSEHRIKCLDFHYPDLELSRLGKEVRIRNSLDKNSMTGIPHFINSGKSVLFEKTSDKILHETFPCREFEHVLENIKIYSLILSPLIVNDQCFGMISFMSTDSERYYSLEDQNNCDIYCNVISYALYHELSNSFKINKHSWTPTKIFKNILNLN